MEFNKGFQPSCSETVLRLTKSIDEKTVRVMISRLEDITGWKTCIHYSDLGENIEAYVQVDPMKLVVSDGEVRATVGCILKKKGKGDKVYDVLIKSDIDEHVICLANIEGDIVRLGGIGRDEVDYVYLSVTNGFGVVGYTGMTKATRQTIRLLENRLDGDIVEDRNNIMDEDYDEEE